MTHSPASLLRLCGASKIYRMGEVEVPALQEADLEIHEGEFLVVIGPSGSGKSTLLNLIGGMDLPTEGRVLFEDIDLSVASERQRTLYRRHEVGFVFQFYNLVPMLTALENVEVAEELARDPLEAIEALRLVGLADRADHFPSQLSGGQQQRVAIARALVGKPRLLLCDEPTGALDVDTGRQVLDLLCSLNRDRGMTIVVISHNSAIARLGQRVARIVDGRIVSVEENAERVGVDELEW